MAFNKEKCLKITALEDDCVIELKRNNWFSFTKNDDDTGWVVGTITLQNGESAYVKGTNYPSDVNGAGTFNVSKQYKVSGSIMSLIDDGAGEATEIVAGSINSGFRYLFLDNVNLMDILDLKLNATTLAYMCYLSMFKGCTGLTSIPAKFLPATTLAGQCYASMFEGCTGLTKLPKDLLPATTLAQHCYTTMFDGCSNLNEVSVYFTDWQDSITPTHQWLRGVAETGTFYCPDELPKITGIGNIPSGWVKKELPSKTSSNGLGIIGGCMGTGYILLKN